MTPRPVPAARQVRREGAAAPRPGLSVVDRVRRARRRRVAPLLAAAAVASSLLVVVIGHAELAQGQVRLARLQAALTAAQAAHRQESLSVAGLETPSRVVGAAERTLHMAPPTQVTQVPHVSLAVPLPAPKVSPASTSAPSTTAAATPGG